MNVTDGLKNKAEPRTLRRQLLLAVNLTLGAALVVLLVVRYQREMEEALVDKHAGLVDEAIAIHQAVSHALLEHSPSDVTRYLESICARMRESRSPGHHIVVRTGDATYQAGANEWMSSNMIDAMEQAATADHRAQHGNQILIVGSDVRDGVAVHVAESVTNIRRALRAEVLTELAIVTILGIVATVIVNLVLLKVVDAPLARLVATVRRFTRGELGIQSSTSGSREMHELARAVNEMSAALDEIDSQRRHQIAKAREIQEHLLPNGVRVPGLQTAVLFRPAEGVSGDYCDFLPLADGTWLICIADVMGHGVPAAMGASMLKMLLLFATERERISPASVLGSVNQRFARTMLPGDFASMFLGHWSPETQRLRYACAGHPSAILVSTDGRLDSLSSTGLLLGVERNAVWQERSVQLAPNDRLLLFTDGAIEMRGHDGELFGSERLIAWFSRCEDLPFDEVLNCLDQALNAYRGDLPIQDDLTLVVLQCAAGNAAEMRHPAAISTA